MEKMNMIECLQQKLEEKENEIASYGGDDKECTTCFEPFTADRRAIVFFPCGHARCCQSCYGNLPNPKKCPECRIKILKAAVLFY